MNKRIEMEATVKAVGGNMRAITYTDGKIKGYIIEYGNKNNPNQIRLMNAGSGEREVAYYRITKSGKGALDETENFCTDSEKTHMNINPHTLIESIENIIKKAGKK